MGRTIQRLRHAAHYRVLRLPGGWLWCRDCGALRPDLGEVPAPWLPPGIAQAILEDVISRWPGVTMKQWPSHLRRRAMAKKRKVDGERVAPPPRTEAR